MVRSFGTLVSDGTISVLESMGTYPSYPVYESWIGVLSQGHGWLVPYGTVQKGTNLEGYGAGPRMRGMLAELRECQEMVTRQNGYHGPQFRVTCGTTQGGLTPPTLFNVSVDNVVHNWLSMTVYDEAVIHDSLVHAVGRSMEVVYEDDGPIGSRESEWLQVSLIIPL